MVNGCDILVEGIPVNALICCVGGSNCSLELKCLIKIKHLAAVVEGDTLYLLEHCYGTACLIGAVNSLTSDCCSTLSLTRNHT